MSCLWPTNIRKRKRSVVFCLSRIRNNSQNRNWPKLFFLSHAPQKREAWVSLEDKSSSTKCPKKDNCRVDILPYFLPSNTMAEDRPADQEISLHGDGHGHQVAPGDKYLTIMIMMWSDDDHDHDVIRWWSCCDQVISTWWSWSWYDVIIWSAPSRRTTRRCRAQKSPGVARKTCWWSRLPCWPCWTGSRIWSFCWSPLSLFSKWWSPKLS